MSTINTIRIQQILSGFRSIESKRENEWECERKKVNNVRIKKMKKILKDKKSRYNYKMKTKKNIYITIILLSIITQSEYTT